MPSRSSAECHSTGRYHVDALAVGTDGRVALATSSLTTDIWDGVVQVLRLDGASAEVTAQIPTPSGNADIVWVTPEALAAAGDDGVVSIHTLPPPGAVVHGVVPPVRLTEHTDAVTCVGVSPDSMRLASGSLDGLVKVWDAAAGQAAATRTLEHTRLESYCANQVHALLWMGEQTLATAAADGVLRHWDLRAPPEQLLASRCAAEQGAALMSLCTAADAAQVAVGTEAGGVLLVDARQAAKGPVHRTQPHSAPVCALALATPSGPAADGGPAATSASASALRIASGSDDCSVALLSARDLACEVTLASAHGDFVRALGWLTPPQPGGDAVLLSGGWDKRLLTHALQFS